jgi:hypothetical protein
MTSHSVLGVNRMFLIRSMMPGSRLVALAQAAVPAADAEVPTLGAEEGVAGGLPLPVPNGSPQWAQKRALSAEARLHFGQIMRSLPSLVLVTPVSGGGSMAGSGARQLIMRQIAAAVDSH